MTLLAILSGWLIVSIAFGLIFSPWLARRLRGGSR